MVERMNSEDKRKLAELLLPHLAWDLTRSEIFTWAAGPDASALSGALFAEQLLQHIRARIERGEPFTLCIIPQREGAAEPYDAALRADYRR